MHIGHLDVPVVTTVDIVRADSRSSANSGYLPPPDISTSAAPVATASTGTPNPTDVLSVEQVHLCAAQSSLWHWRPEPFAAATFQLELPASLRSFVRQILNLKPAPADGPITWCQATALTETECQSPPRHTATTSATETIEAPRTAPSDLSSKGASPWRFFAFVAAYGVLVIALVTLGRKFATRRSQPA